MFVVSHLFFVDVISICMELEVGIAQVHFLSQWICWMPTMTEAAKWQAPALRAYMQCWTWGEDQLLWAAFWTQSETKIRLLSLLRIINAHYPGVWLWVCGIGKSSRSSFRCRQSPAEFVVQVWWFQAMRQQLFHTQSFLTTFWQTHPIQHCDQPSKSNN